MRIIPASGGLEFGDVDGPQIDIIPAVSPPTRSPEALVEMVYANLHATRWQWMKHAPMLARMQRQDYEGIVGISPSVMLRFMYPRGMNLLDGLYGVEITDAETPGWILAMFYAVSAGLRNGVSPERISVGANIMASLMRMPAAAKTRYSRQSSREIRALAEQMVTAPDTFNADVSIPAGAVDRARFWMTVSKLLWKPEHLARLSVMPETYDSVVSAILLMLSATASLDLALTSGKKAIQGVSLTVGDAGFLNFALAWPQALEWVAGDISPEALRWISQGYFPAEEPRVDDFTIHSPISASLMQGMADALLEEARENAAYIPYGQFTLRLPKDNPLAPWGVKRLRVWAEPDRLWVQFVGKGSTARGASLEWRPDRPMRLYVISENSGALAAAHLTLAALWHDLVTAATAALPEQGQEPPKDMVAEVQALERARREGHARGRGRSYRTLPRKKVRIRGRRDWSTDAERKRIMRRHRVSGHLRQLPKGWHASEEAQRWAKRYGFIVPRGYTFVRPHMRGSDEREAETVVVARGLEALMLLNAGKGQ